MFCSVSDMIILSAIIIHPLINQEINQPPSAIKQQGKSNNFLCVTIVQKTEVFLLVFIFKLNSQ